MSPRLPDEQSDFVQEGSVSAWIGSFESEDNLLAYVDWRYDGCDEPRCIFANDAGLAWFDHDLQEVSFLGTQPVEPLVELQGHSYVESFSDALSVALERQKEQRWNAIFLLYDFAYNLTRAKPKTSSQLL